MTKPKNNRQIGIRVSDNVWEKVRELAEKKSISVTEYARRAIDKQMEKDKMIYQGNSSIIDEDITLLVDNAVDERLNNDMIKAKDIQIQLMSEQLKSKDEQIKLLREMLQLYKNQGQYDNTPAYCVAESKMTKKQY